MALGGTALRLFQTFIYALAFCCSAVILGLYSYFLAVQADRDRAIPTWEKAVEGISGAAVLYTIAAVIFTCCLGGIRFFAFIAIVLDVLFCGAFIALAVLTRHGANSCDGFVQTPIGDGLGSTSSGFNASPTDEDNQVTYSVSLRTACRMNTACFAVSIIGAFIFLVAAIVQLWLGRHHQKEKRYGPSPKNNYTSGSGSKWFARRRRGPKTTHDAYSKDAEAAPAAAAGGLAVPANDAALRHSHDTAYTGTTVGATNGTYTGNKYETGHHVPVAGGYHTGPTGTAVNPYGYDNTHTHTTTTTGTATNY